MPKVDNKTFFAMWLFNPFISAIYLFRDFKHNKSIAPYLLLSFFFGLSFVVSTTGADSQRYAEQLLEYHQNENSFSTALKGFNNEKDSSLDIYQIIVTLFVSFFTDNVKVLFGIFSIVFGFFWFKSLIVIRSYLTIPFQGLTLVTFVLLALTNPIWNINGVRMWTAVMIFFYGLLLLNLENNKKGWVFLLLPMLVHFSLIIGLFLYLFYIVTPVKNKNIFFGVFVLTFFLGELNLDIVRSYFELLPGFAQSKGGYLNEEYVELVKANDQQYAFHVVLAKTFAKYIVLAMIFLIYFYSVYKKKLVAKKLDIFFKMALFFSSFSNLASSVPSGGRFFVLSNLLVLLAFLLLLNEKIDLPFFLKRVLTIVIVFVIVFYIRVGFDYIGIFFFIGNPIVNWFVVDTPIIDFIKTIF